LGEGKQLADVVADTAVDKVDEEVYVGWAEIGGLEGVVN